MESRGFEFHIPYMPSRQLHVQSQQQTRQRQVWNLLKVNEKDTRMIS